MHINRAQSAITNLLGFFSSEQRNQRAVSLSNALVGVIYQNFLPKRSMRWPAK